MKDNHRHASHAQQPMISDTAFAEDTCLIHGNTRNGLDIHTPSPSIHRGSTILLDRSRDIYDKSRPTYGRGGLGTQHALTEALCQLEHADRTFLFPSGLTAITGTLLALTSAGDEVLTVDSVYGPTRTFLDGMMSRMGVSTRYFPASSTVEELAAMVGPATRLIFLEAPGSLTFEMQDVPAIARLARERGLLTVIDNSWSAGVLFKPLDHGIDVSIQALTKYVCGHSDVFMGMAATRGPIGADMARTYAEIGWAVSPDDAYMALRGLRTLHARLATHEAAALDFMAWLHEQPEVVEILSPALPTFPGHDIWKRDFTGSCGLFGVVLRPASPDAVEAMLDDLQLFGLGFSWGGYESLVLPCDPQLPIRIFPGIERGPLLRIHIGLENISDLKDDFRRGLDRLNIHTPGALSAAVLY